ncbi:hypothetical protein HK097_002471 [Rhizophlyctis rosea]|uniref:Uncharacterized protein n=1 Tax=Rhizophlyctis rosea TaxID=64517 RepID=A0AAD5SAY4_9FUNG|nr:hypothetical protein HK097_002471 [Rhizophlyctis rosea]
MRGAEGYTPGAGWGGKEMEMSYPGPRGHARQKSTTSAVSGVGSGVGSNVGSGVGGAGRQGRQPSLKKKASQLMGKSKRNDDLDDVSMRDIKAWTVRPQPPTDSHHYNHQNGSGAKAEKKDKDGGCCIIC